MKLGRNGPFTTVIGGEFLSMLGDGVYTVALALLILGVASPRVLALSLSALGVPRGLLLLFGGAATDHFTARQVMLVSHLVRGALVVGMTVLAATHSLQDWHFYAIAAAFGTADAFFWPASKSILVTLVRPDQLVSANSVLSVVEQVTLLAGPLLGGLLVTLWGAVPALAFNAATFAVAAGTVLAAPRRARLQHTEPARPLLAIRTGFTFAWQKKELRVILLIVSAWTLAYAGLFGVGLPNVAHLSGKPALALSIMIAGSGLGQLLGAIGAGMTGLPHRWGMLIIALAFVEALAFFTLGLNPQYWLVAAVLTVLGIGGAYVNDVAIPVWIQATTPEPLLGRVNSIIDVPRVTLEPMSMLVMGLASTVNVRLVFVAAAIPMLLAAITLLTSQTARELRSA